MQFLALLTALLVPAVAAARVAVRPVQTVPAAGTSIVLPRAVALASLRQLPSLSAAAALAAPPAVSPALTVLPAAAAAHAAPSAVVPAVTALFAAAASKATAAGAVRTPHSVERHGKVEQKTAARPSARAAVKRRRGLSGKLAQFSARLPDRRFAAHQPLEELSEDALHFFIADEYSPQSLPREGRNRSREFLRQFHRAQSVAGTPLPRAAKDVRYILVPGFVWDAVPDYMGPMLETLSDMGLDAEFIKTDPLGTPPENADKIRAAIKASDKQVVLIGHSKGGIDALEAIENDPEAAARVQKYVALQSPYLGSEVADYFLAHPVMYNVSMMYARFVNPWRMFATFPFFREATIRAMSRARRHVLHDVRPRLPASVGLYSIASRVHSSDSIKLLLWLSSGLVKGLTNADNDGIVSPNEAVVPGSDYALLDEVGHLDPVSDPKHWQRKRLGVRDDDDFSRNFTEALVRWLFS